MDINADNDSAMVLTIKLFKIEENAYYIGFFRKKVMFCMKKSNN